MMRFIPPSLRFAFRFRYVCQSLKQIASIACHKGRHMPLEKKCTGTARLSQTSRKLQDKVHSHANIILLHWSVLGSFSTSLPAAGEHLLVLGLQEAAVGGPKPVMAPIARHLYGLDLSHENSDSKALQCNLTQTYTNKHSRYSRTSHNIKWLVKVPNLQNPQKEYNWLDKFRYCALQKAFWASKPQDGSLGQLFARWGTFAGSEASHHASLKGKDIAAGKQYMHHLQKCSYNIYIYISIH